MMSKRVSSMLTMQLRKARRHFPAPSMKFLLDQSTDARLLSYLKQLGHDATQIRRTYPQSIPNPEVLSIAHKEKLILITDDRDFGELVFRLQRPHARVIFLRLGTYAPLRLYSLH